MIGDFILTFFAFRFLRKSIKDSPLLPKWNPILLGGMVASVALVLAGAASDTIELIASWIAYLFMLLIVYLIYYRDEFRSAKPFLVAVIPFMAVSFLKTIVELVNEEFYNAWESYFAAGGAFSIIWMIVMLSITNKQNKALAKEKKKAEEEERQRKIMAELKADLEVQVQERTAEITQQKEALEHALNELKETQAHLIHSEKMASLGELTAGIAHEIQNPLNFVNNFSEINKELIDELKEAVAKNDQEEVKAIFDDLTDNEEKVSHHGKRAEGIVKSMLQHSRIGSGQKELTDINALCDEYLRLAYHGFRAKDKSFNADYKAELDPDLPKIKVVPQDIGRVLLNLINNAFQAVSSPRHSERSEESPKVIVATKKSKEGIRITVTDNGSGIPEDIKDKIFQPFFTTKPTGEGTGLGLSMSYDIVTKGHGGELKVESAQSEGTRFIVELPMQ
ncbi:MAG: ATP-binding protein [Cyclobacteriaceae bacterium]